MFNNLYIYMKIEVTLVNLSKSKRIKPCICLMEFYVKSNCLTCIHTILFSRSNISYHPKCNLNLNMQGISCDTTPFSKQSSSARGHLTLLPGTKPSLVISKCIL